MTDQERDTRAGGSPLSDYPEETRERLRADFEREDTRWSTASQARDWAILIAIGTLHLLWMLLVFLYEPGIR